MMRRLMIIVIVVLSLSAIARTIDETDYLGSAVFAGDFYDVLYHNGYLWIADGGQYYSGNLKILDVSDPENPTVAAYFSYPEGSAFRLEGDGDRVFVSVKEYGIKIYDASDPLNAILIGEYMTAETINDMDLIGDLLCVIGTLNGLSILDISDPGDIRTVSRTPIAGSRYSLAVTSDSLLTIASGTSGLHVYSIADPAIPLFLDTVTLAQKGFQDVVCNDSLVFAVYRQTMINSGGFAIIDISNPPNFTILSQPTAFGIDPFPDNGLFLEGDTLFFAATQGGFGVWDVSDPANPSRYGGWGGAWLPPNTARWSTRCSSGGGYAYNISPDRLLTPTRNEACVFDLTDLTDPTPIGFYDPPDWVRKAVGYGDYAYVATSTDGLLVVDITDPENPEIVGGEGEWFINLNASSVLYEDGFAYVTGGWTALIIFDVTNPENPTVASTFVDGLAVNSDIDKEDHMIAVVGHGVPPSPSGWLRLIDVTDIYNPQNAGFLNLGVGAFGVDIVGSLAYVAFEDGLGIVDITNPSNPFLVSSQLTGGGGQDVVIRGNTAFVADQTSGLVILDVSNPFDPRPISAVETPGCAMDLGLSGDSIYVADSTALVIIDVSNLNIPVITDIVPVEGFAQGVSVNGGRIFLCDTYGFHIYSHDWLGLTEIGGLIQVPEKFKVSCSPNPFNPTTVVSYNLQAASHVNLSFYDVTGRQLAELVDGWRDAGVHKATFDGSALASGIYLYRLQVSGSGATPTIETGKMVLLK